MREIIGGILVGVGALVMAIGLVLPGAPAGETTLNLGLLVEKIVVTLIGCAVFVPALLCGSRRRASAGELATARRSRPARHGAR